MYIDLILWDDADDPQGNVQHILGPGEVTPEEVEEVLYDHEGPVDSSDSSGRPIVFGWTSTNFRRFGSPWLQHSPHRVWARDEKRSPCLDFGR